MVYSFVSIGKRLKLIFEVLLVIDNVCDLVSRFTM